MASGNMKDIKRRIKSVQSTMQITKAMELVASSKMRHAKERALGARPYFNALYQTITHLAGATRGSESVYTRPREVKNSLYIVIAGDRGLAGGYNANILKAIEADAAGSDYCVLPIGKKAVEHFERRKANVLTTAFAEAGDLSVSDCFEISRLVCQKFLAGEFDEIRLGFTQFVSMLTQTATVLPVLPFDAKRPEPGHERESLMLYEPDGKAVFDAIIPEYLAGVVYGALCESVASEQGARRMAMDAATKNAGEMIDHLNLYYNRARQAAITQEITEIVAGADAES
jgi:F-type H+-transporting ATPase subunit gamma